MNNSLGNLRAFRAAAVLIFSTLTLSCTKTELTPDACPGGCDAKMVFPVEKDVNGYYHVELNWNQKHLPYFTLDVEATPVDPFWQYRGYSAVEAEFYSKSSWVYGTPPINLKAVQESSIRFSKKGGTLVSKRTIGPIPPVAIGDTVTIHMEVFWDATEKSIFKEFSEKFIVK